MSKETVTKRNGGSTETAHCEDCGRAEITVGELGDILCAECGGDIVNGDVCAGDHPQVIA